MADKIANEDLARLKAEIEHKLEWGAASSWHSSMFDELSEKVFNSAQIMLSVPTLKRFFGVVKHSGAPSITTLDALSQFVGSENWRVFKLASVKPSRSKIRRTPRRSVYVTVGFVLAIVTISLIGNKRPEVVINASEFSFSSRVLSNEYPNTVVFDLEIPRSLRADSLKIQQYWNPTKTINISKDQTQATGIYYFPGYFKAKLLVDDQIAKTHELFLKSNGWLGLIEYDPIPKYFDPLNDGSGISFPTEIIEEVKSLESPVESSFHLIDDWGNISGDNFTLKATIKSTFDDRWAVCQALKVYFIGSSGAMIIPFSKLGCASDNNLMLNDVYLRGKENDLSALSADFAKPVDLTLTLSNKQLTVRINGEEVYSNSYNDTMGRLVGLRFKFLGLGEVLEYTILDSNNNQLELIAL